MWAQLLGCCVPGSGTLDRALFLLEHLSFIPITLLGYITRPGTRNRESGKAQSRLNFYTLVWTPLKYKV